MDQFAAQFGTGYITALVLDWLKRQPWFPFMQVDAAKLNRVFSIVVAIAVSAGLHYTFDPTTRVLAITIPTFVDFMHSLTDVAIQFGMQDISYRVIVRDRTKEILEAAKPLIVITPKEETK